MRQAKRSLHPSRRSWLLSAAAGGLSLVGAPVFAQAGAWPSRTIRLIVPSSPGGVADFTARTFAKSLEGQLKQAVVVENRAGAGAIIGAVAVKNAAPDGYTFLVSGNSTQAANPSLYQNLSYDPARDFDEVAMFGVFPMIGLVRKGSPIVSAGSLIAIAKAEPGKLTFGYHAASAQVPAELLKSRAGIDVLGVPYKSIGQLTTDLSAGIVDFAFVDAVSAYPIVQGGQLNAFAVTSPETFAVLPSVEPVAKVLPGFEMQGWLGLSAPKGTPPKIIARMNDCVRTALHDKAVRESLERQGMTVRAETPAEHSRFVAADQKRWAEWVRIAKIKPASL